MVCIMICVFFLWFRFHELVVAFFVHTPRYLDCLGQCNQRGEVKDHQLPFPAYHFHLSQSVSPARTKFTSSLAKRALAWPELGKRQPVSKRVFFFQDVVLCKGSGSLGFSIIGGTDHSSTPFGVKEPGIFISHVSIESKRL